MANLNFPTSPNDGDTYEGYVYNAAKGVWQWQTLSPSVATLTDTDITSPAVGEALVYDGSDWVNDSVAATLEDLTDTDISLPVAGEVLEYDGTNWVNAAAAAGGKILQVVSTNYTGTFSSSSPTPQNVPGFAATITPSATSSKILVLFNSWVGYSANDNYPYFLMLRNGVSIGAGTLATSSNLNTFASTPALARGAIGTQVYKLLHASRSFVDSPSSVSSLTYQVQFAESFNGTSYVNRTDHQGTQPYVHYPSSDLVLMEIAG